MSSIFNEIRVKKPKRTNFDLSHEVKMSTKFGKLTPFLCQEVVPGDRWKCSSEIFIRLSPLFAPVMHMIDCYVHFFFVPNRLIWDEWEDFITGGEDGTANPVFPRVSAPGASNKFKYYFGPGSLADYLGVNFLPIGSDSGLNMPDFSLLPFRAYQLIYNEYYRDQNLEEEIPIDFKSGRHILTFDDPGHLPDELKGLFEIRYRAWEKDYFTSALPSPQRGADVRLPIMGEADVLYTNDGSTYAVDSNNQKALIRRYNSDVVSTEVNRDVYLDHEMSVNIPIESRLDTQLNGNVNIDNSSNLKVDLTSATSTTINDLRRAIKLQEWLEKNARGGARYVEQLLSHFGVRSSDARLQRPEYLGGGVTKVQISDVVQQTQTSNESGNLEASPMGNLAGYGISVGRSNKFKRFFEEHGIIMGIMSIRPRAAYMTGLDRQFSKFDRFDYYFPEFAHLGEQEIKNKEIFVSGNTDDDNSVFGYTPRYAEYKFISSKVHGDFKTSLDFWHLARSFESRPNLNNDFIKVKPSNTNRIFAVTDNSDKFYCQIYNRIVAKRPMPRFGTPLI